MRSPLLWILGFLHFCNGQTTNAGDERRLNNRPLNHHHHHPHQPSPCGGYNDLYDAVEEDVQGRKLFLVAGAAVGGAALGYHLGMKHKNPVIINNNIYNEHPSPCGGTVVQHGSGGGGGLISGLLGHHPILSNILQGGLWNNGGSGGNNRLPPNRDNSVNWNRAIRQFNRVVRPLTRGFK